jgi:N-acetyl sugar amidotransferase
MSSKPYQMCTRCVMDTSASDIHFDADGVCNYCTDFLDRSSHIIHAEPAAKQRQLEAFVDRVKREGRGKRYDCVVGVSGGVDSSWVLVRVVELGLRPLAVHMDNGWNSELAQNNIANLVQGLGVDLYTHVIDWPEYRALMQAFFDADVIDVELLYDNAMLAVNYQQAAAHGIKWILSGSNQATEGMSIPEDWKWIKHDQRNIRAIAKAHGNTRIRTFPSIGTLQYVWAEFVRKIKWTPILNLMEYNKFDAMRILQESHGYKPYPYKHYESIFTRFYQGYLLPRKFHVDKRRVHFSTLIVSGQMSREDAVADLQNLPYPSQAELDSDRQYFLKKMGWTEAQLEDYLNRPERPHTAYSSEIRLWNALKDIYLRIRR